jgi:eukaryotic-like serine/threonine-protein kinase
VDDPKEPDTPPWAWAALVAAALLIITAGAIVGMVTTNDDGDAAGSPTTGLADTGSGLPPLLPPTVSIPPAAGLPPEPGGVEPIPPATIPTVTTPTTTVPTTTSSSAVGTWPAGQSGYTVVLASVAEANGRSAADAAAQRATTAGLSSVGVLRSSDFSSLKPGYWVTYAGVYGTLAAAQAALPQARAAGFPSAYTRQVQP